MRSSASTSRGSGELRNSGRMALGVSPRRDNSLPAKFTKGRLLGKGGFAEVFETRDGDTQELLALKIVDKAGVASAKAQSKLRSEIEIHRSLAHDRVVRFLEHYEDHQNVYILLELCPNRSLSELVRRRPGRRLSEQETVFYLRDLILGLQYLHSQKRRVIHRDLKLGNLFIDAEGRLKIGDFGLAAKLETDNERRRTRCGTPNYIAPEILEDVGHSYGVDVWSFGVIAYTMMCGRPPFEAADVKAVYKRIQRNEWSWPSSVNLTDSAKDLVTRILRTDPRARPGLDDILAMPFFLSRTSPLCPPPSISAMLTSGKHAGSVTPPAREGPGASPMRTGTSAYRTETPEGQRAAELARIDSPGPRLVRDCSLGSASPGGAALVKRGSDPLRPWGAHSARGLCSRPPLAAHGDENAPPPNAMVVVDSIKDAKKPGCPMSPSWSPAPTANAAPSPMRSLSARLAPAWGDSRTGPPRASDPLTTGPARSVASRMRGCSSARSATGSPRASAEQLLPGTPIATPAGTPRESRLTAPAATAQPMGARTPPAIARTSSFQPMAMPRDQFPRSPSARAPLTPPALGSLKATTGGLGDAFMGDALAGDCGAMVSPDALPDTWVTRWVDYSAKYGIVYSLPDGAIGVYFNDSTKAITTPDGSQFDYITRSTAEQPAARSTHGFEDYPAELQKKVTLLRHFRACMSSPDSVGRRDGTSTGKSNLPDSKPQGLASQVYVRKWSKRGSAVMFQLSNKDTQVVFFDGTEVVLSSRLHMVTYCDKGGQTQSYPVSQALHSPGPELARRLRYILSNLLEVPAAELPAALRA